jgi:phosphoribosylamine-glycine ligase
MLAQQMALEGHQVMVHLHDKDVHRCFEGLVWKSENWEKDAKEADFVVFDANEHGEKAEWLRKQGVKVWGGSLLADRLENDRVFGMEVLTRAGIKVPLTKHFKNAAEAKKLVEGWDSERTVIKLDDPKASKASSYVSKSRQDMLDRIEAWTSTEDAQADLNKGGIIQEFIHGTEISIEGWFDGESFLYPYNITMEDKKLLNDDKGPNTGCAQNLVKQLRPEHPRLARLMLEPLVPVLARGRFIGQIDVNAIVDKEGVPHALEFTPRAGYDATPTLVMGLPGYGEAVARALHLKTCEGEACECPTRGECRCLCCGAERPPFWFLGAVRTYIPPYPFECADHAVNGAAYDESRGVEIHGWLDGSEKTKQRVILYDAMLEDGKLLTAGTCGIPYIVLGHGPFIERMRDDLWKHMGEVSVADLCYRTDLGKKQAKAWPKIEHLLR